MKITSLKKKLTFGLGLNSLVLLITVTGILFAAKSINNHSVKIKNLRGPTSNASLTMLNGINSSRAALNGWIILNQPEFKKERAEAWEYQINPSLKTMKALSPNWTNPLNKERLSKILVKLKLYEKYQKEIELISGLQKNRPASELFYNSVYPLEKKILDETSNIIHIIKENKSHKKNVLISLVDFSQSLSNSFELIRTFLLTGEVSTISRFENNWQKNTLSLKKIIQSSSKNNIENFNALKKMRAKLKTLANKTISLRSKKDWNKARYWLKTKVNPISNELVGLLQNMSVNQIALIKEDINSSESAYFNLNIFALILLIFGMIFMILTNRFILAGLNTSLLKLTRATKKIAKGDLDVEFDPQNLENSELQTIGLSIDELRKHLVNNKIAHEKVTTLLQSEKTKLEKNAWIKESYSKIITEIQGVKNLKALTNKVINNLVPLLNAGVGVIYLIDEKKWDSLSLHSSYGLDKNIGFSFNYKLGEGLVGQCAYDKKVITLKDIPEDYLRISSGTGSSKPTEITVYPIKYEKKIFGVIEIATFTEFDNTKRKLLEQLTSSIGIFINNIKGKKNIEHLLLETQNKSIELEIIAKELESQTFALDEHALVSITDPKGKITYANKKFCEISKYTLEELVGHDHRMVNSGHHPKEFFECLWSTIKGGKVWKGEIKNLAKDGSIYWVDATITGFKNPKGEITQFVAIRTDVTEKKRTSEKISEALIQVEHSAKAKSEFLAMMSHEIRTPMNGILGMVSLLSDTELTEEQSEKLNIVKSCGDSLMKILNDILDLAKIDSGKFELEAVNFNLKKNIEEVLFLSSSRAFQKNIDLITEIPDSIPHFFIGDIDRIRQIFINLLSNAIKFTEEGRVSLIVKSKSLMDGLHQLDISCIDTGIGINEEQQKNLFKEFSQADSSISRKYGGTGLGLAITTRLAHLMGGKIEVESELGIGSTFTLTLTLKEGEKIEKRSNSKFDPKQKIQQNWSKKYPHKILLVEDNYFNQVLGKTMLEKLGYSCVIAGNGVEALQEIKKNDNNIDKFTFILMDIQMPEMDGITATKEIIRKYGNDKAPIVALTANAFAEDKENCLNAGMEDFITKPLEIRELMRVLKKFSNTSENSIPLFEKESLLLEFKGIDKSLYKLIEEFNIFLQTLSIQMIEAIKTENFKEIKEITHKLKGILETFKVTDLITKVLEIEKLAEEDSIKNMVYLFNDLEYDLNILNDQLILLKEDRKAA